MANHNEEFESFAQRFKLRYGYLPLGKMDPLRPTSVETVLGDLTSTYRELDELRRLPDEVNLWAMQLHERIWISSISKDVIRVPGGWLYCNWDCENDQPIPGGTFVPLCDESR